MKRLTLFIFFFAVALSSAFAKLDFQLQRCKVETVSATDDKIIFVVSGDCRFLLSTSSKGDAEMSNANLEHAVVVIKRLSINDTRSPDERQKAWGTLCAKATALQSKIIWMNCEQATYLIEDYHVNYVSCADANFGEAK